MARSRALESRIKSDAESPAFLYVPKGKSVSQENWSLIAQLLKILDGHRRTSWTDAQSAFVEKIAARKLIRPYKSYESGFSAIGRMQFPVWRLLGLAWINNDGVPEVTEIGRTFLRSGTKKRQNLLSMQVHRYQFWNPALPKHFKEFRTFPVLSFYKVLQNIGWYASREEFLLFVSRVRSSEDATEVASLVEEFRACADGERARLVDLATRLSASSHTRSGEGTTYVKVRNNIAYIWNFLKLSRYVETERNRIHIPERHRRSVRRVMDASQDAEFVDYLSEQDWLANYGAVPDKANWEAPWTKAEDAREYYQRIGRIDAAAEALTREAPGISEKRVGAYRRVQIMERVLEDILEQNLDELEPGLRLVRRQFPTAVGPIDLLAQDRNDAYVVIELKRGRTSDRVVGQVLRYLGWVTDRLAQGNEAKARAIVVGRNYDRKFAAAITAANRVSPYTYDIRARFEPWPG